MRIGHGYDVHRTAPHRKLILCGIDIPCSFGLLGHSDADVAVHALIDAMLGAAALGDIGHWFPDSDDRFKDADSMQLLGEVHQLLKDRHFQIANIDLTILAQAPRLSAFIPSMRSNLAKALAIPCENINVKATTEEGLGFTGNHTGIASHCVLLLKQQ